MRTLRSLYTPLWLVTALLLITALYFTFVIAPNEKVMGPVQRIFYFHVGSAITCYACFFVVFVSSIGYLTNRDLILDALNVAAGEVGFLFCTMVLITGMIWGHCAWNTWFSWEEPRLVTFLVLWCIFLAFTLLRVFGDSAQIRVQGAVLGILGSVTVPIVYYSIKLLPFTQRLHPEVIEHGGLKDGRFYWAFGISVAALLVLSAALVALRFRLEVLKQRSWKLERANG